MAADAGKPPRLFSAAFGPARLHSALSLIHIVTPRNHFEHMQEKPQSYFGQGDHPFTRLMAWFFGYIHGHAGATQEGGLSPSELIPDDFKEFVAQRLGHDFATDRRQWWSYIMAHTSSEPEALAMFFRLRAEYDEHQQAKRQ